MDRTSFYGGPSGRNFEIKQIFKNKKEMLADLDKRWQSPIGISDFVVISYGLPGKQEDEFLANQEIDAEVYGQGYNSTLWQKIYTENNPEDIDALRGIEVYYISGNYGIGYKLIASMSGNTPRGTLYTRIIHSYETPYWRFYDYYDPVYPETVHAGLDRPVIIAFLPIAQRVEAKKVTLNAEDKPVFVWDVITNSYTNPSNARWDKVNQTIDRSTCGTIKESYDGDRNAIINGNDRPILWIGIPPGWTWELDYNTLTANQEPTVTLNNDGNTQTLEIRLPRTWKWALSHTALNAEDDPIVKLLSDPATDMKTLQIDIPRPWTWALTGEDTNRTILDANQKPDVVITNDNNTQYLEFKLPQSQVMDQPDTNTIAPMIEPSVVLDNTNINAPKLIFDLPRAVKFFYGDLLGEKSAGIYTSTATEVAACKPGDYYINQDTGFVYIVTDNTSGTVTFQYVARIQAPLPRIDSTPVNPYTANGAAKVEPSIDSSFADPVEQTGWKLNFNLPILPNFSVNHEFVGAGEKGSATLTPNDVDNIAFHLEIPQGSRIFAGLDIEGVEQDDVTPSTVITDSIVGNSLPGDIYLNTKTGKVYKLDQSGVWKYQNEGIKGATGDALNIVRNYTLTVDRANGFIDNLPNGVQYIKDHYLEDDGVTPKKYSSDEIFAITWADDDEGLETSYWYFYTEKGDWGRVQITGGIVNLIQNSWVNSPADDPVVNKTYSIDYINKLIGGSMNNNINRSTFSKSQIQALSEWGTFAQAKDGTWWPEN